MDRFTVAVLTDENTTVEDLLNLYGIKCFSKRAILKSKDRIILDEKFKIMEVASTMRKELEYQKRYNVNIEVMKRLEIGIKHLEELQEKDDEEIYKIAIKKYSIDLINEDGDLLNDKNSHCKWLYYNKDSEYTKFIVVEEPNKPGKYIYTNTAKMKDIQWDLLDHKAILTDASLFPDGTWYDEKFGLITKISKKDGLIEYKTTDAENSILPHDGEMQITIVECFI